MAKKSYLGESTFKKYDLPEGYTQLSYIQSTGTQYINTGVIGKSGLEADIKLSFTSISAYGILSSIKDGVRIYMVHMSSNKWGYGYGSYVSSGVAPQANQIYNVYSKLYTGEQILKVNGTIIKNGTDTSTYNNNTSLALLAYSNAGTASQFCSAKLYSCHIYDNGTLIRDFVPVKNSDNIVGLYDAVEEKFYTNAGTGTFTEGDVATFDDTTAHNIKKMYLGIEDTFTELEYIQSSGTQYIDTGFKHNQDTRVVMDTQLTSTGSTTVWLFEGRNASYANRKGVYYYGSSTKKITSAYGSSSDNTKAYESVTPSDRLLIDYDKNTCTINSETQQVTATTFQSTSNLYLLACNTEGTISGIASAKLYSCQIYDNGTLIRDFVPVKSSSGVVGLYDKVNGKFYKNAGTGTFTSGAELSNKIYVSIAHKVKKAYIGDANGVAKLVFRGEKDQGSVSISPTSITLNSSTLSKIINVTRSGSGSITAKSNNTSVASVSISGTKITVKSVNEQTGTATITITVAEDEDYTMVSITCPVTANFTIVKDESVTLTLRQPGEAAAASIGDYALFGGGGEYLDTVTSFNSSLTKGSPTALRTGVRDAAAASTGSSGYALIGGGVTGAGVGRDTSVVTAYDSSLTMTKGTSVSCDGNAISAASFGTYAVFGGGYSAASSYDRVSSSISAYNQSLTTTNYSLSEARGDLATASNDSYILFAGGFIRKITSVGSTASTYPNSTTVDAFNSSFTRTIPTALSTARRSCSAARAGNNIIFVGGSGSSISNDAQYYAHEVYNASLTRSVMPNTVRYNNLTGVTYKGRALFGGGGYGNTLGGYGSAANLTTVFSINSALTLEDLSPLSVGRRSLASTCVGKYVLFGGGFNYKYLVGSSNSGYQYEAQNAVDIYYMS